MARVIRHHLPWYPNMLFREQIAIMRHSLTDGKYLQELVESEETSASVSRELFLAYIRNTHGGKAGGGGGGVSLQRWLEDRQAAMEKVVRFAEETLVVMFAFLVMEQG